MTEQELFSSFSKDNDKKPEDINENVLVEIPNRKRSCAAVNTPAACVNKAINHIQDLEVTLEKSFQQYEHLYELENLPWDLDIKIVEESEDISTELKTKHSLYWKDIQPLKQKTTTVVAEITELITRLENERKEAEEALEFEKQRRRKLHLNSDKLSLWRLQQLPKAVQKEWEKCLQDIAELQWHFQEKNEQLQDASNQLTKIDVANSAIQKKIDFMKKYSPLLEEKLCNEDDIVNEVKKLFLKTRAVYDIVHEKYLKTLSLHEDVKEEHEKARMYMLEQIEADEFLLNSLMDELKETDMIYTDFNNKINETKEEILQNENLLEELIKQEANIKNELTSWCDKERRLNLKISTQENENKQLLDNCSEEKKIMEDSKSSKGSDIQHLKDKLMSLLQEISYLENEGKNLKIENGEFVQKFRESIKRKVGFQSEIQVLQKNIRRLEEHLRKVNKELYDADLAYDEVKTQLEDMDQNIIKEKSHFKNVAETIRKQIRDEITAWKLSQKKVRALQEELNKKKTEHEKLQKKIKNKLTKLEKLSTVESDKLVKHKEAHEELIKKISHLTKKISELDEKEKNAKDKLENKKRHLLNLVTDKQRTYLDISSKFTKVNKEITHLQKETAEITTLSKGQEKDIDTIEKSITMLREKYIKKKSREENAQRLVDFLHARLDSVGKKIKTDNNVFEELLWNRQNDLKIKKICLDDGLDENLRLAREYQMLQICYLNDKNQLMDYFEHNIRADAALYDQQQLSQLQKKLHRILVEYFRLRALYNQARLEKFQAASYETIQKILVVKGGLSETVENTSSFLKSLTDGSST